MDKELKWTSFDVVAKVRNLTKCKKVGHAGTLDPLADGLLILCLGRATKTIESYQDLGKEYLAEIKLGATTVTYDSEAEEENITDTSELTIEQINSAISKYVGKIEQIPPAYSAKKIGGQRMYKLARENKPVEAKPSQVEIYSIDVLDIALPVIKMKIHCSKGTYIRSLARDIGADLNVGGYLKSLRRTAIGIYKADDALTVTELSNLINNLNSNNHENL